MHSFNVKIRGRKLVATDSTKQNFLDRLLDDYDNRQITLKVSIEIPEKHINQNQWKLYKAFILKAANHFGTDFEEMHHILKNLRPVDFAGNPVEISRWTSKQLNDFIDQASSYLAQYGFNF